MVINLPFKHPRNSEGLNLIKYLQSPVTVKVRERGTVLQLFVPWSHHIQLVEQDWIQLMPKPYWLYAVTLQVIWEFIEAKVGTNKEN